MRAAGDITSGRDAALFEDEIGGRRGGLVRAFHHDFAVDGASVRLPRDDATEAAGTSQSQGMVHSCSLLIGFPAPLRHRLRPAVWAKSPGMSRRFVTTRRDSRRR